MSIEDWFNKSISRKDFFKTSAKGAAAGAAVTLISPAKMVEAFQERRTEDTTFVPKEKNGFLVTPDEKTILGIDIGKQPAQSALFVNIEDQHPTRLMNIHTMRSEFMRHMIELSFIDSGLREVMAGPRSVNKISFDGEMTWAQYEILDDIFTNWDPERLPANFYIELNPPDDGGTETYFQFSGIVWSYEVTENSPTKAFYTKASITLKIMGDVRCSIQSQ